MAVTEKAIGRWSGGGEKLASTIVRHGPKDRESNAQSVTLTGRKVTRMHVQGCTLSSS